VTSSPSTTKGACHKGLSSTSCSRRTSPGSAPHLCRSLCHSSPTRCGSRIYWDENEEAIRRKMDRKDHAHTIPVSAVTLVKAGHATPVRRLRGSASMKTRLTRLRPARKVFLRLSAADRAQIESRSFSIVAADRTLDLVARCGALARASPMRTAALPPRPGRAQLRECVQGVGELLRDVLGEARR
jgi:hypothetical protein